VLDLSGNALTAFPNEVLSLTTLKSLSLTANTSITSLPDGIGALKSLQALLLSGTQIAALPAAIGGLSGLQDLELVACKLTTLPPEIGQLAALSLMLIAFDVWRRSGTFLKGAFAANTAIMALGLVLFGYQFAGYATS